MSVFRQPSGFANGHTRDLQDRFVGCSHQHRCVTGMELDGSVTVLADRYGGKRLDGPNDVGCRADGTIRFTDPHYGINTDYEGGKTAPELPPLYCLDPESGILTLASDGFAGPKGLAFSPDGRLLYVSESGEQFTADPVQNIQGFEAAGDWRLSSGRVFHTVSPGYADGFRLDGNGNVWSSAADGVHCIAPDGTLLGRIKVPFRVSNLAFGGRHRSRLFICASHALMAIYTKQRGAGRPHRLGAAREPGAQALGDGVAGTPAPRRVSAGRTPGSRARKWAAARRRTRPCSRGRTACGCRARWRWSGP